MQAFNEQVIQSLANEQVAVFDDQGSCVNLRITEVCRNASPAGWRTMAIQLQGHESFRLTQGSYRLQHERLGEHRLFMVPVSAIDYEIIIQQKVSD